MIQRFFSKKRNVAIVIILLLIIIVAARHLFISIQQNVEKMIEAGSEPVTYVADYPQPNTTGKSPQAIAEIKRGEYLTKAGDCIACHTNSAEKGIAFAGGLPMQTPFGTIYAPNITSDKETGLGNWTDEDFIKAMRTGISPSGKHYYPAFPYLYFNQVTTEDLKAIKAYLDSIPPVHQEKPKNTMVWPFNWRFLQSGWRLLFFYPAKSGPFQPDPKQSEQWNRGAYLVEGLGHCAMCHTPSYYMISEKYSLGAPIRKYHLSGAKIQGYLAPNISKGNMSTISDEEMLKVFTHNRMIGGGNVEGPMLEANQNSLKYLTEPDLRAIITYIKSVDSAPLPVPKGGVGAGVYHNYCEGCHATGAGGAPIYGDPASWSEPMKKGIAGVYDNAIKGIDGMPAKGTCFSCADADIKEAVDYMVASISGKKVIPPVKKLSLQDGKKIYSENCSVCHSTGFKNAPKLGDKAAFQASVKKGFVDTYLNVVTGNGGHPPRGACADCTDAEIKAAVKYLMTESSEKNYSLW